MEKPGFLTNICPVCSEGKIFKALFSMNKSCPKCKHVFEKESGYFMGAMLASYFIGIFLVVPTVGFCIFILNMELIRSLAIGVVQMILMQTFFFRFSRILWIQVEHRMTKKIHS